MEPDQADLPLKHAPTDARLAIRLLLRASGAPRTEALWQLTPADILDLAELRRERGSSAVFTLIGYIGDITDSPPPEHLMAQLREQQPELAEDFLSYNDQLIQRGERIGQQRGEQIGQQRERERFERAQRRLILALATDRFGAPSAAQRRRLAQLRLGALQDAAARLLNANGWDELIG